MHEVQGFPPHASCSLTLERRHKSISGEGREADPEMDMPRMANEPARVRCSKRSVKQRRWRWWRGGQWGIWYRRGFLTSKDYCRLKDALAQIGL